MKFIQDGRISFHDIRISATFAWAIVGVIKSILVTGYLFAEERLKHQVKNANFRVGYTTRKYSR
jgi:flagellar biosynthesis protein FlhB